MIYERLYVVQWCYDREHWQVVWDDTDGRRVPAAYDTAAQAEKHRAAMAEQFPDAHYRVVGFEHKTELITGSHPARPGEANVSLVD